jgi:hypothetical protein
VIRSFVLQTRPLPRLLALSLVAAVWLLLAPHASAELLKSPITLGPTTVLNGTATVTGTLNGTAPAGATVAINGAPVGVNANGTFVAVLDVAGRSSLELQVTDPASGGTSVVSIPLNTNVIGLGGVIPSDVLAAIERAAVSVLEPVGGFKILDGEPITVGGSVLHREQLAGLTVNGRDVLGTMGPGPGFSVPIPGTSRTITVVATDHRGVTTTTAYPVTHQASAAAPAAGATVAAAKAVGVRVASVRYVTKGFRKSKRVRMIVTVKDNLGRLVRGATVQVNGAPASRLVRRPKLKRTDKLGRAGLLLTPRARAYGKRLFTVTIAKTPTAKAQRKTSVRVPKLRARSVRKR